jgi:hypothetical protein
MLSNIINYPDELQLMSILDSNIDSNYMNIIISKNYFNILQARSFKKNYLISAKEYAIFICSLFLKET